MIQDIGIKHLRNEYEKKVPQAGDRLMAFWDSKILRKKGETLDFLLYEELAAWCRETGRKMPRMVYLFSIPQEGAAEIRYFLMDFNELTGEDGKRTGSEGEDAPCAEPALLSQYEFVRMFEVRIAQPKAAVLAAATAWHLYCWYRDNQYCGRCGTAVLHSKTMRMLSCPKCGNQIFPKIAPAVIVGVTNGNRILMTKYAGRAYRNYALIAGFTEIGETAEETVAREVMEEVGLRVKNIRYYKSQPWGFDSNLLLGYFCELDGTAEIQLDTSELAVAEWVDYRDIPDDAEGLSLTREMMVHFRESRKSALQVK